MRVQRVVFMIMQFWKGKECVVHVIEGKHVIVCQKEIDNYVNVQLHSYCKIYSTKKKKQMLRKTADGETTMYPA